MKKIVIVANASIEIGSGHIIRCLTIAENLRKNCFNVFFMMENLKGNLIEFVKKQNFEVIIAVGNNQIRQKWQQLLLDLSPMTTIIHPQTVIAPSAKIGRGVSIMAGCILGTNTVIQDGVILNIGTLLDHEVRIEPFAHLSVGVKVASYHVIPAFSFLEVGSVLEHTS